MEVDAIRKRGWCSGGGRGVRVGDCWSLVGKPRVLGSLGKSEKRVGDCWSMVGRMGVLGSSGESEIRVGDCWSLVGRMGVLGSLDRDGGGGGDLYRWGIGSRCRPRGRCCQEIYLTSVSAFVFSSLRLVAVICEPYPCCLLCVCLEPAENKIVFIHCSHTTKEVNGEGCYSQ